MPSTYTQNLGIQMPADGEQAGTWGDTVNANYGCLDAAIDGNQQIQLSASTYSLATGQTQVGQQPSQGVYPLITWTGTLTQDTTVTIGPNTAQKRYTMVNATQGGFRLIFTQGSGGSFTLYPGYSARIYTDGGGGNAKCAAELDSPQFNNMLLMGSLQVRGALSFTGPQTFNQPVTFNGAVSMAAGAAINGLTLTNGSPAAYDLYYRSPSTGQLTPLPIGAVGQQLIVLPGPSVGWGLSQASIGSTISGSIANALYFADTAAHLAQDGNILARAGVGIGLGVFPSYTMHLGYGLAPQLWLDTNSPATGGQQRELAFGTNGQPRWLLYSPAAAESGGNTGSNIALASYNDGLTALTFSFSAFRATGNLTIGQFGDYGAQLAVINRAPSSAAVIVRGASGQSGQLQQWQDVNGNVVASVDAAGNASFANSGTGLALDGNGRLNLHGTIGGSPWGTIHIGPEGGPVGQTRGSITFQTAGQPGSGAVPANVIRVYYSGSNFVIQFYFNGANYYAYLPLNTGQASGQVSWWVTTTPISF